MSASSVFRAAGLIAVVTVFSKFLGLFRDQFIAHAYGASFISDAYLYAFQIPSFALILLGGVGGPFHTATIAVLSRFVSDTDPAPSEIARQLLNTFLTWTGVVFALASVLVYCFAAPLANLLAANATADIKLVTTLHLQWMSPMILIGGLIGIFYGVSNLYKQYFWPSISPSAINVTLILWLWILGPDSLGLSLAISTMLGALLQLLIQIPEYLKVGYRFWPNFNLKAEGLSTVSAMLFPAAVGTTIGQLNVYVAMFFASQLAAGSWTAFVMGNRLIQLPIGVLTIGMLVPLFPRFNQWIKAGDIEALKRDFHLGVQSMWLFAAPLVVMTILLAEPGVRLLFERGAFTHHDTLLVAQVLVILAFSVMPYMLRDAITRVFYAFQDSRTPLIAGGVSIVLNAVLNALLVVRFDIAGIAVSTVVITLANALMLLLLSRKHTRALALRDLVFGSGKIILAAGVAYAAAFALFPVLLSDVEGVIPLLIAIVALMFVISVVYTGLLLLLKDVLACRFAFRALSHPCNVLPVAITRPLLAWVNCQASETLSE